MADFSRKLRKSMESDEVIELARSLKRSCCEMNGGKYVEKDPKQTAQILHRLGDCYLTQAEEVKENFIYSAGLLVAAQVRDKDNKEITNSLNKLWTALMRKAGVTQEALDFWLVTAANKQRLSDLRKTTSERLEALRQSMEATKDRRDLEEKKIEHVQEILTLINSGLQSVLRRISEVCEKLLFSGKGPCEFAHVILGSLARCESTHYSDIEHLLLFDPHVDDSKSEDLKIRLQWYTVAFHVLIISLGESPLRLLGIPCLNDFKSRNVEDDWFYDSFTKCGVQIDSNMPQASIHPLKTGLIGTPLSIARQLDNADKSDRNGYHLSQILCKSVCLTGKKLLHQLFRIEVSKKIKEIQPTFRSWIKEQMSRQDAVDELCRSGDKRNIKKLLYRGISVIVSHLGSFLGSNRVSSMDVIDDLVQREQLKAEAGHNLKYALAVANEIRLRLYEVAGEQIAEIETEFVQSTEASGVLSQICAEVGTASVVDFFAIFHTLWCELHAVAVEKGSPDLLSKSFMRGGGQHAQIAISFIIQPQELKKIKNVYPTKREDRQHIGLFYIATASIAAFRNCWRALIDVFPESDSKVASDLSALKHKVDCMTHDVRVYRSRLYCKTNYVGMSREDIMAELFPNSSTSTIQQFATQLELLQDLFNLYMLDKRTLHLMPHLLLAIYRIANFASSFKCIETLVRSDLQRQGNALAINQSLGHLREAMKSFRSEVLECKFCPSDEYAPSYVLGLMKELLNKGQGFFTMEEIDFNQWEYRLSKVRLELLALDTVERFFNRGDDFTQVVFNSKDWSYFLTYYSEALLRDVDRGLAKIDQCFLIIPAHQTTAFRST